MSRKSDHVMTGIWIGVGVYALWFAYAMGRKQGQSDPKPGTPTRNQGPIPPAWQSAPSSPLPGPT